MVSNQAPSAEIKTYFSPDRKVRARSVVEAWRLHNRAVTKVKTKGGLEAKESRPQRPPSFARPIEKSWFTSQPQLVLLERTAHLNLPHLHYHHRHRLVKDSFVCQRPRTTRLASD